MRDDTRDTVATDRIPGLPDRGPHGPRMGRRRPGPGRRGPGQIPAASMLAVGLAAGIAVGAAGPSALRAQDPWPGADRDRGRGVVSHALEFFDPDGWPAADTMVVREDTSESSAIVARFIFLAPQPYEWSYAVETDEDGIEGRALEFDYEILGLPVDSVAPDSAWVRVLYGRGPDGAPRHGWVRSPDGHGLLQSWDQILPERPLFFLGPADRIRFHDVAGGDPVPLELAPGPVSTPPTFDYRMEPLEVDGRWMKVRVVTPDDACGAEPVETREHVTWIEYLDDRGRPRVWYYTRGC